MSDKTQSTNTVSPKRVYEAPRITEHSKFENLVLTCGRQSGGVCTAKGGLTS